MMIQAGNDDGDDIDNDDARLESVDDTSSDSNFTSIKSCDPVS